MKIYISPSMQKYNAYAYGNTTEAEQCHLIGVAAKYALIRAGFDVKLADPDNSAEQNVAESNAWGADYHVCIHTNATGNGKTARDVVVFTSQKNATDPAAKAIYNAIDDLDDHKSIYGLQVANFYEIKYTSAKCIYIECDFHDNVDQAKWIIENRERIGQAIADGFSRAYPQSKTGFEDVDPDAYYAEAVRWAVENGITMGTDDTHFSPDEPCTRAQVVTFLYRALGGAK